MSQYIRTLLLVLSCSMALQTAALATPETATDETATQTNLPTVEVTGTRLKRTDLETSSPVDVITRADIQSSGNRTLSEVVRSITANNNGTIGPGNVSGFAMGSTGVALRGLAVNATLVLINGRRMTSYGLADDGQRTFVNLSDIPLEIVDRIEILKDGGSAIYGSDAIAGVINIILRDHFEGLQAQLSYGVTEHGDGQLPGLTLTAGHGNLDRDGYNVFIDIEASDQHPVYARDRADRQWIGTGDLRPYGYSFGAGGSGPDIGGWFDNTAGTSLPNHFGTVSPASLSTPQWQQLPGCDSRIPLPPGLGGCPWDRVKETGEILPSESKLSLYLRGSMRISTQLNPYIEFGRFRSDTRANWVNGPASANDSWVNPSTNSVVDTSTLILPAAHPDNPLGVNARLTYLLDQVGQRVWDHDSVAYRVLIGTQGKLGSWDYDTGFLYAHDGTERTVNGFVRYSVLLAGLNGTGPYGYLRLGRNAGLNSPAFLNALSPTLATDNRSSLTLVDFKARRTLLTLPGGALGLALGAEYRRETLDAPALPYSNTGDVVGWPYYVYGGALKAAAAFAEIDAPVLQPLELDAAVRVDRVWDTGTSATPKFGFKWRPWAPLVLRGTYSEGFRAPNPAERGSNSQFSGTLALTGNGFLGVFRNTANPNLTPERSNTFTLGGVLEPWPGTSLGVNFWWLERKNEINSVDPFAIVAGASGWPNAVVVKNAAGDVLEVSTPYENNSHSRLRGIDFDASGRLPLPGLGNLVAKLNWSYLASFRRTFSGGVTYEYAGTHGPLAVSGNTGTPQNRGNLTLAWETRITVLSANVNFVGGFLNVDHLGTPCASTFADGSPAPLGCHVASFTTVDLTASYRPTPRATVSFSVTNLFDRIAPLDPSSYINLNFDPSLHLSGAIGRTYNIGLRYGF
jgi:iron complex outermembrane receptor protein